MTSNKITSKQSSSPKQRVIMLLRAQTKKMLAAIAALVGSSTSVRCSSSSGSGRRHHVMALAFGLPTSLSADRRNVMKKIVASAATAVLISTNSNKESAVAVIPFAPTGALLPAARVKIMIDRAVDIASELNSEENAYTQQRLLHHLEHLLLTPQNFNSGTTPIKVPQQPAKSYLDAYASNRKSISPLEKPGAMLVQQGEIDTWKRLKRQEKAREDTDEIRAAFNYYTSNLNFDSGKFYVQHLCHNFMHLSYHTFCHHRHHLLTMHQCYYLSIPHITLKINSP